MRFRWLILAFLVVAVGSAMWLTRDSPRPPLTKIAALLSADASQRPARPVAVIGTIQASSRYNTSSSEWWFTLEDGGRAMPVHYTGAVPSTFFDEDAKVLVTGTLRDGTFNARSLAVRVWM